MLWW